MQMLWDPTGFPGPHSENCRSKLKKEVAVPKQSPGQAPGEETVGAEGLSQSPERTLRWESGCLPLQSCLDSSPTLAPSHEPLCDPAVPCWVTGRNSDPVQGPCGP